MMKHIHLLGICGTFMGGIARLACQLGYQVSGADLNVYPPMSDLLKSLNIKIYEGYDPAQLQPHPDLVIIGNVMSRGNAAVEYVLNQGIPYQSAPQWLAENVLASRTVLAVSGTHGKTTTTSLLSWILTFAGLKPGYLIGGVANNFVASADLGEAPFFVIEGDEYDSAFFDKRSKFIHYRPQALILNNIEFDHGDIFADLNAIYQQFEHLLRVVPGRGVVIYPEDNQPIQTVLARGCWSRRCPLAGKHSLWQTQLLNACGSQFEIFYQDQCVGEVNWSLLGVHNVANALAAVAAAVDVGVDPEVAVKALAAFQGVRRRLEIVGKTAGITLYDDFAHHPTAIHCTLQALRHRVGQARIVAILQFASNTMRLGMHPTEKIVNALTEADMVFLLKPPQWEEGRDSLRNLLPKSSQVLDTVSEIIVAAKKYLQPNDQVVIMSNKGFGGIQEKLLAAING